MYGDNSTRLKIVVRTHGSENGRDLRADWTGSTTTQWTKRLVPVPSNARSWVQIVGKLGQGKHNYIAVDDVEYVTCRHQVSKGATVCEMYADSWCLYHRDQRDDSPFDRSCPIYRLAVRHYIFTSRNGT